MSAQWAMLLFILPLVGYFFVARSHGRAQTAYCLILFSGYLWAVGQQLLNCMRLSTTDENAYRMALYLCYSGMCLLGPACVYLAWCYAGRHKLYGSTRRVLTLFGIGAFYYLAVLTNDLHHLYYASFSIASRSYGPLYYPFVAFSYTSFVYAFITVVKVKLDRYTPLMVLLCFLPPVAANTWGMMVSDPALDFTPAAYCLMVLGTHLLLWYTRPMLLSPLAARNVLDHLGHPVRITTSNGTTLYRGGAEESDRFAYRDVAFMLEEESTLLVRTDITAYKALQHKLEDQKAELEQARLLLLEQAAQLARQSKTAAQLAASQRQTEITTLLDREVRGELESLLEHTKAALLMPEQTPLTQGIEKSAEALELVRSIVREVKTRDWDAV